MILLRSFYNLTGTCIMRFQKIYIFVVLLILFSLFSGCEKFAEQDKFKRPDWLPGKLYTTVFAQENLGLFAECLRLSGLDTIIDVSGSWTVFAPNDEAIKEFLLENHYSKIQDIPPDELDKIAKFHIIQNPWSFEQLQSLSIFGWRTSDNSNKNNYAYKRQTILKEQEDKYWIIKTNSKEMIVADSLYSESYKKVYVRSRKYVPVFYDKYMDVNGLTSNDFRFYFDRDYEHENVYFAGAKIIHSDIFAENGFVHIIDKVVKPMLNAREILEQEFADESYKTFLDMVYWYYPDFEANMGATMNQPEIRLGGVADTLWDLAFSPLKFNLHDEIIGNTSYTLVRHNGLFAPTDAAFNNFTDNILTVKSGYPHWSDLKSLPIDVVGYIIPKHFSTSPLYPSTTPYRDIFGTSGSNRLTAGNIIRKEFGSNCTFIGVDAYIPDKVFTSVTAPVFLRPTYTIFRKAMIYSGAAEIISNHGGELYFFPIPDYALNADSSLILNWVDINNNSYYFSELNRSKRMIERLSSNTIRSRILNMVGTPVPNGNPNKDIIRTLGGRTITWDRTNNTIQGAYPCTIGYKGEIETICSPVSIDEPTDNGKVWSVRYWFNF